MRSHDPATGDAWFSKRRRRYEDNCEPRELTFSCFRGFPFLDRDRTRQWFAEALRVARRQWPVDVWAYVIMPEHMHLLVRPRVAGVELGRFAGYVKEHTARPAIHWLAEKAPEFLPKITVIEGSLVRRRFWQPGGGYDRNVIELHTLEAMIDYIHHNPVRRELCLRAIDWEWSSARWYAGIRPVPIEMDATQPDLGMS